MVLVVGEFQFNAGVDRTTAHQHAGVVNVDVFSFPVGKTVYLVRIAFVGGILQAGSGAIQSQTDRVKNGGLAGTGGSAYQKNGVIGQRAIFEINDGVFNGSYIVYGKFLEFHGVGGWGSYSCLLASRLCSTSASISFSSSSKGVPYSSW